MSIATLLASGMQLLTALEDCFALQITAPSGGYTAGDMLKTSDTVGVIYDDALIGETAVLIYKAPKIQVPCAASASGSAYAVGEKVYFDAGNARVTEASTGNTLCGIVLEAAGVGVTTVVIELNGTLGIVA